MKRLVTVLLLMTSISGLTQDWHLINPERAYYYGDDNSGFITQSIFTDSVSTFGQGQVYYLNRIAQPCDTCQEVEEPIYCASCAWNTNQAQFLGFSCFWDGANSWSFETDSSSFLLLPHAHLGDSWAYNENILATVTQETESTFLEIQDSIKVISLSNGDSFTISKNGGIHGLQMGQQGYVQLGRSNPDLGLNPVSFEEVFSFEPGLILQYRIGRTSTLWNDLNPYSFYSEWGHSKLTVLDVSYSQGSVTCIYHCLSEFTATDTEWPEDDSWTYQTEGIDTIMYSKLDLAIDHMYPLQVTHQSITIPISTYAHGGQFDGTPRSAQTDEGRRMWYLGHVAFLDFEGSSIFFIPEGIVEDLYGFQSSLEFGGTAEQASYSSLVYGHDWGSVAYLEGIGIAYYSQDHAQGWSGGQQSSRRYMSLEGFVLDGDTTGTVFPDSIYTSVAELNSANFGIWPNPVSEKVNITFEKPFSGVINLYNLNAGPVLRIPVSFIRQLEIPLDGLAKGLYVMEAITSEGRRSSRRLVIN